MARDKASRARHLVSPERRQDGTVATFGAPVGPGSPSGSGSGVPVPGMPGLDGEDGQDGVPGLPGAPGVPGAVGAAGAAGAVGPMGPWGAPALDGEDGVDGVPGPPGAAGTIVTPAALSKVNDTNVTLTLGGTIASALLQAVSLTLGWTGLLGLVRGGTNADLSATGGAGQYLKQASAGAAVTVGTIPAGDVVMNGANAFVVTPQTGLGLNAFLVVTFDGTLFDTASYHSNSVNNSRLTVPVTGKYLLCGGVAPVGTAIVGGTAFYVALKINGTTLIAVNVGALDSNQNSAGLVSTIYPLTAGDYVELYGAFFATSGTWATQANAYDFLSAHLIGK